MSQCFEPPLLFISLHTLVFGCKSWAQSFEPPHLHMSFYHSGLDLGLRATTSIYLSGLWGLGPSQTQDFKPPYLYTTWEASSHHVNMDHCMFLGLNLMLFHQGFEPSYLHILLYAGFGWGSTHIVLVLFSWQKCLPPSILTAKILGTLILLCWSSVSLPYFLF